MDWAAQDKLCKTAQAWVEKANAANTERMRQEVHRELAKVTIGAKDMAMKNKMFGRRSNRPKKSYRRPTNVS